MYSGLGDPDRWVLPEALFEQARTQPDAPWIVCVDGGRMTFGEAASDARRMAGRFAELGVRPGDRVGVMLPSGCDFVRVWLGLGALGAAAVLLNTELRGPFLHHQLASSRVALAVVDPAAAELAEELAPSLPDLRRLLVVSDRGAGASGRLERPSWAAWRDAPPHDGPPPRARDVACIMFTSGTSGPAKGVLMPHAHCALYGIGALEALRLGPADRYYICLPLFHSNGLLMQLGATLLAGIPAIVRTRFSASSWLPDIHAHGATATNLLGALAAFVIAQPAGPGDRAHGLRALVNGPNLAAHEAAFRRRFGVRDVISGYGMTEVNIPVWGRLGQSRPGAAGWVDARRFELVVADPETDRPVPAGAAGEILVRPKVPFGFMVGYDGLPEKTVEAWRNLWFHTGDAGTVDEDGLVTFIDRLRDCIRRRGENISAAEVESVVAGLPGVAEVAAFAAPSDIPGGEDELMLAVVPSPGSDLSAAAVGAAAAALLPRFARPRFVELMDALPRTATGKVRRDALRRRGAASALDLDATPPGRG